MACKLCKTDLERGTQQEKTMEVCDECAARVGLRPLPAVTRPRVPCTRCNGRSFVHALPREHYPIGELSGAAPMFLTTEPKAKTSWLTQTWIDPRGGQGMFETYVCRTCGFVEWYCVQPDKIPIGKLYNTELVELDEGSGPYR